MVVSDGLDTIYLLVLRMSLGVGLQAQFALVHYMMEEPFMVQRSAFVFSVLAAVGLFVGGCASEGTMGSGGAASSGGSSAAAANSLQACLDRIPSGSSAGARQVAEESCRKEDALRMAVAGAADSKSGDRVASGTQGDTLEACMARIPKDASAGQRMLAEESCKRDQANRR